MFGELLIKPTETIMLHGAAVFGTVRQTGPGTGHWQESWLIHVPSLNFAATEKSRAIAEDVLVSCYCRENRNA
jgi:hypothetical protein